MDQLVVPEGVDISPERLAELTQLFEACWEEVLTKRPDLVDAQKEASLRYLVASRIMFEAAAGMDDMQELRRTALEGIL
jgi:hypothetical protein